MKKLLLLTILLVVGNVSLGFCQTATESVGHMMVISNVSIGFDAQASITVIAPDGTQKEKALEFNKGSAKKVAANMTEVHKATLLTINEYTRNGWHVVSVAPSGLSAAGSTFFTQNVYILEKL